MSDVVAVDNIVVLSEVEKNNGLITVGLQEEDVISVEMA